MAAIRYPPPILSERVHALFRELAVHPVLMDIGANGEPPGIWRPLARHSTYLGIGPYAQPLAEHWQGLFRELRLDDRVVTTAETATAVMYVPKDPAYSSLLPLQPQAASVFLEPGLEIDRQVLMPAVTVEGALRDASLAAVDWVHANLNGLDVPILHSLGECAQRRPLAIDTCLDLVDLWDDQSSNVVRYPELINQGFWLSRLHSHGLLRMRRESVAKLAALDASIDEAFLLAHHRRAPGWLFVRFLRTLESMAEDGGLSPRDYVLLWTCALLDCQLGFVADLLLEYERRFGADAVLDTLLHETTECLGTFKRASLT